MAKKIQIKIRIPSWEVVRKDVISGDAGNITAVIEGDMLIITADEGFITVEGDTLIFKNCGNAVSVDGDTLYIRTE